MKTYTTSQGQEFTVNYADALSAGHGHKTINVILDFRNEFIDQESKEFKAVTSDMSGFDEATDLENQEKYEALFELVKSSLDNQVSEWIFELA